MKGKGKGLRHVVCQRVLSTRGPVIICRQLVASGERVQSGTSFIISREVSSAMRSQCRNDQVMQKVVIDR